MKGESWVHITGNLKASEKGPNVDGYVSEYRQAAPAMDMETLERETLKAGIDSNFFSPKVSLVNRVLKEQSADADPYRYTIQRKGDRKIGYQFGISLQPHQIEFLNGEHDHV